MWKSYSTKENTKALLFTVDASKGIEPLEDEGSSYEPMSPAVSYLKCTISIIYPLMPILILANHQDLDNALSKDGVSEATKLEKLFYCGDEGGGSK